MTAKHIPQPAETAHGGVAFARARKSLAFSQFNLLTLPGVQAASMFLPPAKEAKLEISRPMDPARVKWIQEWDRARAAEASTNGPDGLDDAYNVRELGSD